MVLFLYTTKIEAIRYIELGTFYVIFVEWILKDNLPIRMQIQIHKYIWPTETKGV